MAETDTFFVAGVLHLPPLPGAPACSGDFQGVIDHAMRDADALIISLLHLCSANRVLREQLCDSLTQLQAQLVKSDLTRASALGTFSMQSIKRRSSLTNWSHAF